MSRFFPAASALTRLLRLQPNHESRHGIGRRLGAPVRLPCHGPPLEQDDGTAWFAELSAPVTGDTAIGAGALGIPRQILGRNFERPSAHLIFGIANSRFDRQ